MPNRTANLLRTLAVTALMTAALSGLPPLQAQTPARAPAAAPPATTVNPVDERDSRETRQRLHEIFNQYPPSVAHILRLDPSLLAKPEYLSPYPTLAGFIAQHPEVAHNPAYFIGQSEDPTESNRGQALRVVENVFEGATLLIGFVSFFTLVGWIARAVMDHRTWLRASKMQAEAHAKLVDRLSSNEDLLAYLQSPTGQRATTMWTARPSIDIASRAVGAPINRMLWSLQAGVILAAGGIGLWLAKGSVIEEAAQALQVVAVLAVALGVGFVVSALVAYALSRQLGLIEAEPGSSHA